MFICSSCSFASRLRLLWSRHQKNTGHELQAAEIHSDSEDGSYGDPVDDGNRMEDVPSSPAALTYETSDDLNETTHEGSFQEADEVIVAQGPAPDDSPQPDPEAPQPANSWYPWLSRCHYYLTVLYHCSHRRNFDQETLRAMMDILKFYVGDTEYFPSVADVVNFRHDYWEDKIFKTRIDEGNVFSFLRPEGVIAMRLGNPLFTKSFDRVPRKNAGNNITSQSCGEKFKSFEFRKLGNLLQGDLVQITDGEILMEGFPDRVPCQLFFNVTGFYIQDSTYKVEGKYFFHSSLPHLNHLRDRINNNNCYIHVRSKSGDLKFEDLKYEQTLRSRNAHPVYSQYIYDEGTPQFLYLMSDTDLQDLHSSLGISEQTGCVQVVSNVHIDDASQVQSKMWKSASVCDIQFAGAPAGVKGGEHNNIIVGLTDTATISLKRLFDGILGEFDRLSTVGFECYDAFTGKIEKIKAPVAAVFGDLPAKAEITPFTGFQADCFCPRDMFNKKTGDGLDIRRDLRMLRRQIQQIKNERTEAGKKRLGVKYGLDVKHLDSVLDGLLQFDLTQDLPADVLHHFTLGWGKKSFIFLKNDVLAEESLNKLCLIFDKIIWKEYKSRTNSNALRKAGSQIGRNIKSLMQVVWYGLWILIGSNPDLYRADLEVFLRAFFYLAKINYLFFNEHEVGWSATIFTEVDDSIRTALAIFRRDMEVLVPGPKTHDLEHHIQADILRHGNPAGFDCQAGESKMKIQKLKNNYSNKQAPGKDVAQKYLKTEIVRHIVTGGVLNESGTLVASNNVLQETLKMKSLKKLIGLETQEVNLGKASLMDYTTLNGKKKVTVLRPKPEHIVLGVPDEKMKTCSKVETENGPVYKDGGLYILGQNGTLQMGMLSEVYKSTKYGVCYAVIERLQDVTAEKGDPFLMEAKAKVWKRKDTFFMTQFLHQLLAVPLMHACNSEPAPCSFVTQNVDVREERQIVQQRKLFFNCKGRKGTYFITNVTAFSIPTGVNVGCC